MPNSPAAGEKRPGSLRNISGEQGPRTAVDPAAVVKRRMTQAVAPVDPVRIHGMFSLPLQPNIDNNGKHV